jgi:predicted ATPase
MGTARDIAEEFLSLAEQQSDAALVARGHVAVQTTLMHLGEFASAMEHFEKGRSFYDHEQDRDESFRYTQNPAVGMRCHGAWTLWFLGQPDHAWEPMREALTLARDLSEPHGVAHTLYFISVLHHLRREPHLAQEFAEASIQVSNEHGLVLYQASGTVVRGWALFEQGMVEEGIQQMRHGIDAHKATGTEMARPLFLSVLAEALGKTNRTEEGLSLLEEALALVHRKGERCYLSELNRLKGELILLQATTPDTASDAEACFHRSIEFAEQQKAKACELRARMSLSRLYKKQNKHHEARDVLSRIYASFTEGFDTADLREAKALLIG